MSQSCEVKRIQLNSAQSAVDQATIARDTAKKDYVSCLPTGDQGQMALADAQPALDKMVKEAEEIAYMHQFVLGQLEREAGSQGTLQTLGEVAQAESTRMQEEIDRLKSEIRTERRRFLDANPSVSPASGSLYFTKVPDNQLLIAFLSCFGGFLLFAGLLIILNHVPVYYFTAMTMGDRIKLVGAVWVAAFVMMYIGFYAFT
jgi:hypothetical protein